MLEKVFDAFGISEKVTEVIPFGTGLINSTWKIINGHNTYILQRINHNVFKNPGYIAENMSLISEYLYTHYPDYLFVTPLKTVQNQKLYHDKDNGYFRLVPFVKNSHTIDVVSTASVAYEAARQFGELTKLLAGFDASLLKITLPRFHDLTYRHYQFKEAIVTGNMSRIKEAKKTIDAIFDNEYIVDEFEKIKKNPAFKIRATHHDTKISNVLFDNNNKGLCVIDLDTLMPGYFISDAGDMLRTYLSPVSEEEKDFTKIGVRNDYFINIVKGYVGQLKDELTSVEKAHFVYSGKFMIYMQAMRFLTDHLNGDRYYGAKYNGHNYVRAVNQLTLLTRLTEKEEELQHYVPGNKES
jgi:hypothetical protein